MRPSINRPFSVEFDGRQWDAATTGQAIVFVSTADPAYERGGPGDSALARITEAKLRDCGMVDVDLLRDWSFTPEVDEYCDECGGHSEVPVNHGRVHGVLVNRALLFRFIPPGASGTARLHVGGPSDPILLDGGNWRVYLMGMDGNPEGEAPELSDVTGKDGSQ